MCQEEENQCGLPTIIWDPYCDFKYYGRKEINKKSSNELIKLYYQWNSVIVRAMEADAEFKGELKELVDGVLEMIKVE